MILSNYSVRHPVVIGILLIALVLFGLLSVQGTRQDFIPSIELPTAVVVTSWPGGSPRDMEREVTNPLEKELGTLANVQDMTSTSMNSVSLITIEFNWGEDLALRIPEVREKISVALSELPDGISGQPEIFRYNSNVMPVFVAVVEGPASVEEKTRFLRDRVVPRLSRIKGVAEVVLQGDRDEELRVTVSPDLLASRKLSLLDVYGALSQGSVSFPGGDVQIRDYRLNVRTDGEFRTLEDIEILTLAYRDGTPVSLGDVASVEIRQETPESYALSRGDETLSVALIRRNNADTRGIILEARELLAQVEAEIPGIQFRTVNDDGVNIALSMKSVRNSALTGAVLAVLVLLFFLHNIRMTFIVGLSIPLSILIAFLGLKIRDQSLNLMTLGGLTVAIGMMVDSSIVVLENIHSHFARGKTALQAAIDGTSEVGGAVLASTTTSLAVFIPLLFLKDYTGIILKDVAWTIIFSIFGAMVVSLVVVPWLSSLILVRGEVEQKSRTGRLTSLIESGLDRMHAAYEKALSSVLHHPGFTIFTAVFFLMTSLLIFNLLGFSFLGPTDMGEVNIYMEMPDGYTLEQTRDKSLRVMEYIRESVPELESELAYPGREGSVSLTNSPGRSFVTLRLKYRSQRERSVFEVMEQLQREIPARIPDVKVLVKNGGLNAKVDLSFGGSGYSIELAGSDLDEVIRSAHRLEYWMAQDPDTEKTSLNISTGRREGIIRLDPEQAGRLGVSLRDTAWLLRLHLNGATVGKFRESGLDRNIFLTTEDAGNPVREDLVNTIFVPSASSRYINLANIGEFKIQETYSSIKHSGRLPSVIVTSSLKGNDLRGINERIRGIIDEEGFPSGVNWRLVGSASETFGAFASLLRVMVIALFLVYMVMVIQFERFRQPLIVMASVPFILAGMALSLLLMGSTLTIIAFLGGITLAGIVVNNAIVMIDYINMLRFRDHIPLKTAVLSGASSRLKPILMATLTTVLGILPMAMGLGEGSEMYAPLGQTIAGGLISSTLITLFLIPLLYFKMEQRVEDRKKVSENPAVKLPQQSQDGQSIE
ncbi:efflux RND transporter permease subunit [Oceanispirochaeta sp.]|jgi:HAE1 family hydrophobic/amphiphilic exporter-1|uniref:efflux RND transporter permease subunit n=1 Tax=Oceanispirochaeta sp. TaxID=2035350 RepID=UPI00262CBC28|nr:efflux RND transporter permease subunit [Oceanispirochaeta sp.]MDA3955369.1 efflux RND transporter permease subunit [Oceanispirochaeta sp.]